MRSDFEFCLRKELLASGVFIPNFAGRDKIVINLSYDFVWIKQSLCVVS